MNNSTLKILLIIIIAAVVILYIILVTYIITQLVVIKNNQNMGFNPYPRPQNPQINPQSYPQPIIEFDSCRKDKSLTDFFIKSVQIAEKNLYGKSVLDAYKYGNRIELDNLDEITKKTISLNLRDMMIDSKNTESRLRDISQQENVPLYFVILHEAIKKISPVTVFPDVKQLSNEEILAEIKRRHLKS